MIGQRGGQREEMNKTSQHNANALVCYPVFVMGCLALRLII